MPKTRLEGWKPEAEMRPLRLATLILAAIGSFVAAILCFRVLTVLSGGREFALWVGLCVSPPLAVGLWVLDEQRRRRQPRVTAQDAAEERDESEAADLRLQISREVA